MLLQTNSYIVPKERRAEHARLIRRFRQALARIGCDQFEVYEQVGANWSPGGANGRYVQIMRFRDRHHQQAVQAAEREDHGAQHIIAEFCELINFPYQQQHGYFATGFYTSVLPVGPKQAMEGPPAEEMGHDEASGAAAGLAAEETGEWQGEEEAASDEEHETQAEQAHDAAVTNEFLQETTGTELPQSGEDDEDLADQPHASHEAALDDEATEDEETALAEDPAQIAGEAAFLDSLSEEDLPTEGSPSETTGEMNFADAPIAAAPLAAAAEEELVTAEAFVPHMPTSHENPITTEPELGDLDFSELENETSTDESEASTARPVIEEIELNEVELAGLELTPFEPESAESSAPEAESLMAETVPTAVTGESPAPAENPADVSAEIHHDAMEDMGLEFADAGHATSPSTQTPAIGADEFGLDFAEWESLEAEASEAAPAGPLAENASLSAVAEATGPESESDFHATDFHESAQAILESPAPVTAEPPIAEQASPIESPAGVESSHDTAPALEDLAFEDVLAEASNPGVEPAPVLEESAFEHGETAEGSTPVAEMPTLDAAQTDEGLAVEEASAPSAESQPEGLHFDTVHPESPTASAEVRSETAALGEGLHFGEAQPVAAAEPTAEVNPEAPPLGEGLHFDELEPAEASAPVAEAPTLEPALLTEQPAEAEPTPADPPPAIAGHEAHEVPPPAETAAEEFALDEGLIFDDEDLPHDGVLPEVSAEHADHTPHGSLSHDHALDELPDLGAEDASFNELLDDPNLLSNAPASENGNGVAASHPGHDASGAQADAQADKDADLLEFDAFLRQLDEEHKPAK